MGKTAWGLQAAVQIAEAHGVGVLFVSLEMAGCEIGRRLLSAYSGVDSRRFREARFLSTTDLDLVDRGVDRLRTAPVLVDDSPMLTAPAIAAKARRLAAAGRIGVVIVDYIQNVEPEDGRESRQEQIAKITRRLKSLARELSVPVVALSQLNRQVEQREDRRPRMADLRESGAIEQDADQVILLHRPDYYDPDELPGLVEVIVAKNRNGPTGTVKLTFVKPVTRFDSFAAEPEPDFGPPPERGPRPGPGCDDGEVVPW
jgi:replicative DNA helicase